LYILDRVKGMIISGGENVYSAEVEDEGEGLRNETAELTEGVGPMRRTEPVREVRRMRFEELPGIRQQRG
jgi:acyl-CoA synthetase (AMP-forming)/AMP-acid ligase II